MLMTAPHFAPAALNLLAAVAEPRAGESAGALTTASPFTPALIIGLCVAAGLATWLALPGRREIAIRRVAGVALAAIGLIAAGFMVRWTLELGGMSVYFWLFSAVALFASVRVITHTKPVYSALYFVLTVFATGGLFVLLWAEFIAAALVLIYAGAILITYVFVIMLASESLTGGVGGKADLVSDTDGVARDPFWASLTGFAVTGLLIFLVFDKSAALDRRDDANRLLPGQVEWSQAAWGNGQVPTTWRSDSVTGKYRLEIQESTPADGSQQVSAAGVSSLTNTYIDPNLGSAQGLGVELLENQALNVQLAAIILTVAMVGAITLARRRVIVAQSPMAGHDMVSTPATPVDDNPKSIAVYGTDNPRHKAYPET